MIQGQGLHLHWLRRQGVATAMESFTLYLGLAGAHIRTAKAQIRVFMSSLVLYLQPRQPGGRTWKSQQ